METELTKTIKKELYKAFHKQGVFCCPEVTIGWFGKERVDYMVMDTKYIFRCFEIKITVADFHSPAAHTFCGHFNYYVTTPDVYEKVEGEIPENVGVYVFETLHERNYLTLVKRAKKQGPTIDKEILYGSLIRSLSREAEKVFNEDNELVLLLEKQANTTLEKKVSELKRKYNSLILYLESGEDKSWKAEFSDYEYELTKKELENKMRETQLENIKKRSEIAKLRRENKIADKDYERIKDETDDLFIH